MSGTLYIVGTPIGNLGDMSPRAVETLSLVDFIAAEDTRVTVKLLNHFGIKKPLVSYYEHNKSRRTEHIVSRLTAGESCALVTDAGMPAISDPGSDLIAQCRDNAVNVAVVPGPSAIIAAAALSGLDVSRFTFEGFLTVNKPKRLEHLAQIKNERRTMIFYEAPHKLAATLKDLYLTLGDRRVAVIKELTKIHESVELTTLERASALYEGVKLKGEYVIIIEGVKQSCEREYTLEDAEKLARELMLGGMSVNEAAKTAALKTGIKKSDIYRLLT